MIVLKHRPLDLRLRHTFRIARGASDSRRNVLVEIEEDGYRGLGEAAPIRRYHEDPESAAAALDVMASGLVDTRAFAQAAGRVAVEGNRRFNPGWHLAIDLGPMLTVSECIARAALERTEHQLRPIFSGDIAVKADPIDVGQGLENQRRGIGHVGDAVGLARYQPLERRGEVAVHGGRVGRGNLEIVHQSKSTLPRARLTTLRWRLLSTRSAFAVE